MGTETVYDLVNKEINTEMEDKSPEWGRKLGTGFVNGILQRSNGR